jgi:H+/Cl- antiporter ClcA
VVRQVSLTAAWKGWPFLVLGAMLGAVGALYKTIIGLLPACDPLIRISTLRRAALKGASIGLTAWFAPTMVGGGDNVTQAVLSGHYAVTAWQESLYCAFSLVRGLAPLAPPEACSLPCVDADN